MLRRTRHLLRPRCLAGVRFRRPAPPAAHLPLPEDQLLAAARLLLAESLPAPLAQPDAQAVAEAYLEDLEGSADLVHFIQELGWVPGGR